MEHLLLWKVRSLQYHEEFKDILDKKTYNTWSKHFSKCGFCKARYQLDKYNDYTDTISMLMLNTIQDLYHINKYVKSLGIDINIVYKNPSQYPDIISSMRIIETEINTYDSVGVYDKTFFSEMLKVFEKNDT